MKLLTDHLADSLDYQRSLRRSPVFLRVLRFHTLHWLAWLTKTQAVNTADQLRGAHLEAWLKHLSSRRTAQGRPLKPSAINKYIECSRGLLSYLVQRGLAPKALLDVLQYVKQPRHLPTSVLAHAQMRRALSGIDTSNALGFRDRTILELLYTSGLRAAELLGLELPHVDLSNGTALVTGKGDKQRVVPIGQTALRLLESYVRGVRPFLLKDPSEQALWLNAYGGRLQYQTLLRQVHRRLDRLNLPAVVTPHTFRRSCTTELVRGGANLWHVKDLLGHESLNTLEPYTKLTIVDLKKTHARCHPRERDA